MYKFIILLEKVGGISGEIFFIVAPLLPPVMCVALVLVLIIGN